jgi:hypothetical protein
MFSDIYDIIFIICMFGALFFAIAQLCISFYDKGYNAGIKQNNSKNKKSYKYNKANKRK